MLICLLLAAAVSVSFWAGYLRRTSKYIAEASAGAKSAPISIGLTAQIGGTIRVTVSYDEPILLGGFAIRPEGRFDLDPHEVDELAAVVAHSRALRGGRT